MNKKNKILVGCLSLLLVLSVGYALFSETITINGTATAKGDFALTTSCVKGLSSEIIDFSGEEAVMAEALQGGYENDYCTVNGTEVSYGANLLYPSALRAFTITIENTGTIDAILNPETGINVTKGKLCGDSNNDGTFDSCRTDLPDFASMSEMLAIVDSTGTVVGDDAYDAAGNIILSVGDTMHIVFYVNWPNNISDDSTTNMEFTGSSVTFDFVQTTAQ